jgi:hypothetical protein
MSWDIYKKTIYEKWKKYWWDIHPPDIAEYSWDYLFTGGKEIRPRLFCELWEYLSPDLKVNAELAFAIECIHVTSILLDDTPWMDNADERRGRKTLHFTFSPKKALLLSYDIMIIVRTIWYNNKPEHISSNIWNNLLQDKFQRLIIGQWLDLEKKGKLEELASLKTGVLFELVTETVALCIGLDTDFWKLWGNNLGILFQWMDDWLDREQDIHQNNRNAFNESYNTTMNKYIDIWTKIQQGIGLKWFSTHFGMFLKKYFTERILLSEVPYSTSIYSHINVKYNSINNNSIVLIQKRISEQYMNNEDNLYSIIDDLIIKYKNNTVIVNDTLNDVSLEYEVNTDDIMHSIYSIIGTYTQNIYNINNLLYNILSLLNIFLTSFTIKTNLWDIDESEWLETNEATQTINNLSNILNKLSYEINKDYLYEITKNNSTNITKINTSDIINIINTLIRPINSLS